MWAGWSSENAPQQRSRGAIHTKNKPLVKCALCNLMHWQVTRFEWSDWLKVAWLSSRYCCTMCVLQLPAFCCILQKIRFTETKTHTHTHTHTHTKQLPYAFGTCVLRHNLWQKMCYDDYPASTCTWASYTLQLVWIYTSGGFREGSLGSMEPLFARLVNNLLSSSPAT